jgi:hypothetical protein
MRCFIGVFLICLFHCSCGEWRAADSKQVDPELERIGDEIQSEMQVPPEVEIQGFYGMSFEYSAIRLCESGEVYWADGEEIHKAFTDLHLPFRAEAYARLRGRVLGPGTYGHLSAYKWGFEVTKVLEMRPKRKGDCK